MCGSIRIAIVAFNAQDLVRGETISGPFLVWCNFFSHRYDGLSRLSSLSHDLAGTTADQNMTFAYNPASQIVTRTSSNDAYASTTITNETESYGVNGLNQYTSVGGTAHLYDPNGNLSSDGTTGFGYDAENRLVAASGAKTATLLYDPLGRLFQTVGGATTTQFLYDGDRLVAEYDGSGNLKRRFVHGTSADEPLLWYEGAGLASRRGLLVNHQGSIIAVADAAGSSLALNGYDAWGVPNSGNLGRFGYTGQAWLPELGLYHYKARIYSPGLGRFLQTDPVGYEDQINLYAYVGNDPLNAIDPSGRACTWLNSGSPYCQRADKYAQIDGAVMAQTRFFAAASATVQSLAGLDLPGSGRYVSAETKHFMSSLSLQLERLNDRIARDVPPTWSVDLLVPGNCGSVVRYSSLDVLRRLDLSKRLVDICRRPGSCVRVRSRRKYGASQVNRPGFLGRSILCLE